MTVEVWDEEEGRKGFQFGLFTVINGDVMFDPLFILSAEVDNGTIRNLDIIGYENTNPYIMMRIDENDMAYYWGKKEKDMYGLKRRFSSFLDTVTILTPYLCETSTIKPYCFE